MSLDLVELEPHDLIYNWKFSSPWDLSKVPMNEKAELYQKLVDDFAAELADKMFLDKIREMLK